MTKKIVSSIKFNPGDFVVYPAHGVGKISDISTQKVAGTELELIVVSFEKDKMTLRVPMSNISNVGLRKISDSGIMNSALDILKGKPRVKKMMWSRRAQEYEAKINSGDPSMIAEVVRDLYRADNLAEQSYSERQIYEQALDRLTNEVAVCDSSNSLTAEQRILGILNLK